MAFQVLSDGPLDLVLINESVLPIEALGHHPMVASYLERFAGWGRLVVFDRTGVGLSDAVPATGFGLDDWVDDIESLRGSQGGSTPPLHTPTAARPGLPLDAQKRSRLPR